MDPKPGFSVIIAAHDEGAVIEQTLRSILANSIDRPLQVVVVANGCTDDTASRARELAKRTHSTHPHASIEVIDTPVGNKIHALNLGDRAARYFPRAFIDADIELSPNTLSEVIRAFETNSSARIVAPGCRHLYTGHNPFLAGYYALWRSMPYVRNDTMARGFYAIDAKLHDRFTEFPSLTADDKFIRNLTKPGERAVVESAHTRVYMPATFRDLLRVKTRWTYGNLELAERKPELNDNDREGHKGVISHLLPRPWLWLHVPTFLFVYWYAQREARKRLRQKQDAWARADSSRAANARTA